ncbi:Gfo/Idh/MocA family protein [Anaerosphaera multitolerans]|uniref:Gfo/Idh/MocA family oxidoreductase n=1 Tax=Anaerosphaera multitolerans TaxID=2487351 RepID=A0A437S7Z6_9FIRM|nr:Gfo/Idh/MocA family oxidoreductase [Anaerosphaera multitolerans]RVU55209.1 gfo/Idh/MocA family oxidoreductase [Anaerosphaera multitolerans]
MNNKKTVVVGIVGAGYGSTLHCEAYKKVSGANIRIKYISDIDEELATAKARTYNIENITTNYKDILNDKEVDILDICTPPMLHEEMIIEGLRANKHVICEKPLIGYFGESGDKVPIGLNVSKEHMYNSVLKSLDKIKTELENSEKFLMYAENFVYAPNILKAAEIMKSKKTRLLFLKGEESLKGSSSSLAGQWSGTGGGSLIRLGCHPLGGIVYLKKVENSYSEDRIEVESVIADVGSITKNISEKELKYHTVNIEDVEDFSNITITYSNGSKAIIIASDTVLGGTKNYVEIYGNNLAMNCNLTPIDALNCYMLDDDGMEGIKFSEMLPTAVGWNKAFIADEIMRGYTGELEDFVMSVVDNREPISNFDIAYDTIRIIYAAYFSAESGKRIYL